MPIIHQPTQHPTWCDPMQCDPALFVHRSADPAGAPVLVQLRQPYAEHRPPVIVIDDKAYTLDKAASINAMLTSLLIRAVAKPRAPREP